MSVENGVAICFSKKDYELQLWNEQGEITQIKGMLTIAFLIVSSCSHIDRKELYLIIKIPYRVNMPKKEIIAPDGQFMTVNLDEYVELKKEIVPKLRQRINELESKIDDLNSFIKKINSVIFHETGSHACNIGPIETAHRLLERDKTRGGQIRQFEKEIKKIKDENIGLKELLGKGSSGWQIKGDNVAVGLDPFDNKIKQYGFPKNFEEKRANELHFTDKKFYMCNFKYFYDDTWPWPSNTFKSYDMPITLYEHLCKIYKSKSIGLDIHNVKSWEQMKDFIYSLDDVPRGRYVERMGRFILKRRMESGRFTAEELDRECGFKKNRKTRRDYCKKFIKWGFIGETKKDGVYKTIF